MIDRKHLKKESFARRFVNAFSDFFSLSGQEMVFVAFLAVLLAFVSMFIPLSREIIQSSPTGLPITIEHFGFPFESLRKTCTYREAQVLVAPRSGEWQDAQIPNVDVGVEGFGLMVNLVVYALPLIAIIKMVARIKEEIDYRRYDRT